MGITRKRGKGIRIEHNKTLFWIIILLLILFVILIYFIFRDNLKIDTEPLAECSVDVDCIPACGCHPESCVSKEQQAACPIVMCTQVCSGSLDCGAGSCGCVNNKCEIVPTK